MCGFAGFVSHSVNDAYNIIHKMSDAIYHRGPDSDGAFVEELQGNTLALGFRRLSIIDVSENGNQPFIIGNHIMTFNGEVYNHVSIRKELEALGHVFKSNADSEVVLRAFIEWGQSCVHKFIGMFAFAIFAREEKKVFLCRDRVGVKPLYYQHKDNNLIFGSELKSLINHPSFEKNINKQAVNMYFQYRYIPAPHTIFENTHKLTPGHWLVYDIENNEIELQKYWDYFDYFNKSEIEQIDDEAYVQQGKELLRSSFDYRMVSDVPVGVFLSGGYDSSLVAGILAKDLGKDISTFTVGFKEKQYDESTYAKSVAKYLGTKHTEYLCSANEVVDVFKDFPKAFDEPFGDYSALPTMLLAKQVRKDVKVALSADGGDELFAGYKRHKKFLDYHQRFSKIPKFLNPLIISLVEPFDDAHKGMEKLARVNKLLNALENPQPVNLYKNIIQGMTFDEASNILRHHVSDGATHFDDAELLSALTHPLNAAIAADYKTFLVDDVLQKVDRATMYYHLEGREPFLDHRIAEWAAKLPVHLKYGAMGGKHILKVIAHDLIPKNLLDRPKLGFGIPINEWLSNELSELFKHYTSKDKLEATGLFNVQQVERFVQCHLNGKNQAPQRAFVLLAFMMWWEEWMGF